MELKPNDPADHKLQLRIPAELAIWLKAQAADNCRSLNGEVLARLKESKKRDEQEVADAQTA